MDTTTSLRPLGRSEIKITPIGLGCWQFGKRQNYSAKVWPELSDETIEGIVEKSLAGGINWFDTAEIYGNGASESALAAALKAHGKRSEEVVVATKWWPMWRTSGSILRTIDRRLACLDPFGIDLHQVHHPFSLSASRGQMRAMAELIRQGKIRCVGVSNFTARRMRKAHAVLAEHGHPLVSNQVKYNLLDRRIEHNGVLEAAKELGITIIAFSPLEMGLLSGKFHDDPALIKSTEGYRKTFYKSIFKGKRIERTRPLIDALRELGGRYQASPSQVALNWLIHFHGETVVAIPGATKVRHAEQNVAAMGFRLTDDELNQLDRLSQQVLGPVQK